MMITIGTSKATREQIVYAQENGLTILGIRDDGVIYYCPTEDFNSNIESFDRWVKLHNDITSSELKTPIRVYHERRSIIRELAEAYRKDSKSKPVRYNNSGFMAISSLGIRRIVI